MATIHSPIIPVAPSNNYAIRIPIITSVPCRLSVQILRKTVFRDDNGNPRPVNVTKDLTKSTVIKILTPRDDSTWLKIQISIKDKSFQTNPQIMTLEDLASFKAFKVGAGDGFLQIRRALSKDERLQLKTPIIINTIDPDDECAGVYDPIEEEQTKQKVLKALLKSNILMNLPATSTSFGPLVPSLDLTAGASNDGGKENKEGSALSDKIISSPKAKDNASPNKATLLPSVFNFGRLANPQRKRGDLSPKKEPTPAGGAGIGINSHKKTAASAISKALRPSSTEQMG